MQNTLFPQIRTTLEIARASKLIHRERNKKKRKRIGRSIQIGRRSSVAANSGAEARDDSDHYEDQRRHQETHVDSLPFQIPIRENEFLPRIKKK